MDSGMTHSLGRRAMVPVSRSPRFAGQCFLPRWLEGVLASLASANFLLRNPPIRHEHQLPNNPAPMLDGNRVTGLAFAHQGAADTDGLFQAVHLIEAVF